MAAETYAKILIRRPENKSMDEGIVLDRKSFEALAVESRVRILKSLRQRRKTLSELADEMKMSVSGVKEHLQVLEQAELVRKMDDGHKWKYYELTKKGSDVVAPKELRVWILLSISIIALAASAMAMLYAGVPAAQEDTNAPVLKALPVTAPMAGGANETPLPREDHAQAGSDLAVPVAVGAISALTLAGCLLVLWRNRARG
ncbi:MAG: winged helix-turn-helix domain-containing protein [Candidatus ainarchaeum sp.]|nr:winged helix-turn-helix domain-containing protein [Candidatus ainarchaeum sp.]